MDSRNESHLNMQRTVEKLLDKNTAITDTVIAVKNLVIKFKANIVLILKAVQAQAKQTAGIATDKGDARKLMCETASEMGGFGTAYAREIGNDTLYEELNYSKSDLMHLLDDVVGPTCMGIYNLLKTNQAALADYGITDDNLQVLKDLIDTYEAMVPDVRTAEVERSAETEKIDTYIKANSKLLADQLDKLIPLFKTSNADFVDLYFRSRVLVDPKHFTTALRIAVTDSASDLEVPGATLKIIETGDEVTADDSGIILWKPAQQGDWHYEVSADGYTTFTGTIHVTLGAETDLEVKLVRIV